MCFSVPTDAYNVTLSYLLSLPSRRLPVECAFSPDGLLEARFRARNTPNLREGEQLHLVKLDEPATHPRRLENTNNTIPSASGMI